MALRISRRSKYLIVLAFISLCLYGSIGTHELSPQPLQTETKSSYASPAPKAVEPQAPYQPPKKQASGSGDATVGKQGGSTSKPTENVEAGSSGTTPSQETSFVPGKVSGGTGGEFKDPDAETMKNPNSPVPDTTTEAVVQDPTVQEPVASASPVTEKVVFQIGRKEHFPVDPKSMTKLPKDPPANIPKIQAVDPSLTESNAEKSTRRARQAEIKAVFKRDWDAYRQFAWMHDELTPVSNGSYDPFGGWGATLVDALDTLIIMDLQDEYEEASAAVAKIDFTYTAHQALPLFEICIRYLGGLLAAFDLGVANGREDPVMLSQAKVLGQVLYGAFDTPNRLPMLKYNYREQAATENIMRAPTNGVMSEVGSLSVEFTRLAQLSEGEDRDKFFDAIQRITNALEDSMEDMVVPGLWPLRLDLSGCKPAARKFRPDSTSLESHSPKSTPPAVAIPSNENAAHAPSSEGDLVSGRPAGNADRTDTALAKAQKATDSLLDVLDQKSAAAQAKVKPVSKRDVTEQTKAMGRTVTLDSGPISEKDCEVQGIRASPSSFTQTYSQGALADSTYEYFTKEYLLLGGGPSADQYRRLYESSIEATKKWLLFKPLVPGDLGAHDLLLSGDISATTNKEPEFQAKMQHLTCFIGGMFAMGSKVFDRSEDLKLAARLTDGCVWAYNFTATGVAPEVFHLHECKDKQCKWQDFQDEVDLKAKEFARGQVIVEDQGPEWANQESVDRTPVVDPNTRLDRRDATNNDMSQEASALAGQNFKMSQDQKARVQPKVYDNQFNRPMFWVDDRYILRPEAIESVWYMYRITGDKSWQEKGWTMWKATEALTRTKTAHTAVTGVLDFDEVKQSDSLESFWFAETLKYYYLLFSDFETISLDDYVLNTEAHPFKRP